MGKGKQTNKQNPRLAKNILKKEKTRKTHTPNYRIYYEITVIKIACYWQKNKHIDQWEEMV